MGIKRIYDHFLVTEEAYVKFDNCAHHFYGTSAIVVADNVAACVLGAFSLISVSCNVFVIPVTAAKKVLKQICHHHV